MRATTFCETVGDVEAEALINTMRHSLTEVETETADDTLRDVNPKA